MTKNHPAVCIASLNAFKVFCLLFLFSIWMLPSHLLAEGREDEWTIEEVGNEEILRVGAKEIYRITRPGSISGTTRAPNESKNRIAFWIFERRPSGRNGVDITENKGVLFFDKSASGEWIPNHAECGDVLVGEIAITSNSKKYSILAMIRAKDAIMGAPLWKWVILTWTDLNKPCEIKPVTKINMQLLFP